MTEIPPSRYRVVERGRRLEVIDRERPVRERRRAPRRAMGPGGFTFRTSSMWDAKGPRRVALDATGARRLGLGLGVLIAALAVVCVLLFLWGWPGIVVAGIVIGVASQQGKELVAGWLDRIGDTVEP